LKQYTSRDSYTNSNREIVYRFGRIEKALEDMHAWREDFGMLPYDLVALGCSRRDLDAWIHTLETGIHKTGRKFNPAI
jgi:hypothetical protein